MTKLYTFAYPCNKQKTFTALNTHLNGAKTMILRNAYEPTGLLVPWAIKVGYVSLLRGMYTDYTQEG